MKIPCYTVLQMAPVLGCNANVLRDTIKAYPQSQPYPTIRSGNQVKIPKVPFHDFLRSCCESEEEYERYISILRGGEEDAS